jgi:hypothetical protein
MGYEYAFDKSELEIGSKEKAAGVPAASCFEHRR